MEEKRTTNRTSRGIGREVESEVDKEDYHSLDQQIKDARKRAEEFSLNISKTRKNEDELLKKAEEERRKWAASYEEKTVMIEQLQRELASTVEALNNERNVDKYSTFANSGVPTSQLAPASAPVAITSTTTGVGISRHDNNLNGRSINSNLEHHQLNQRYQYNSSQNNSNLNNTEKITTRGTILSTTTQLPSPPPPPPSLSISKSNHLSSPYHPISQTLENNLRHEIITLKLELEQAKNAWKDSETKIQFYLSQIKQLEFEINLQNQEKITSHEKIKMLEKLNKKFENELNVLKSFEEETKRSHHETMSELQQTINILLTERERFEKTVLSRDEEIQHLRDHLVRSDKERGGREENMRQLHQKEIELLQKQHELQIKELLTSSSSSSSLTQQYSNKLNESFLLSPVMSTRESNERRQIKSMKNKEVSEVNQSKEDVDHWLNELKNGTLDSDEERNETRKSQKHYEEKEKEKEGEEEEVAENEINSREFVIRPENPPNRSPLSQKMEKKLELGVRSKVEGDATAVSKPGPGPVKPPTPKRVHEKKEVEMEHEEEQEEEEEREQEQEEEGEKTPTPPMVIKTKGTSSQSILDVQSHNPPRAYLANQTRGEFSLQRGGDEFLSHYFTQDFSLLTEDGSRRGYSADLISESSQLGNEIQLQSPERFQTFNKFKKENTHPMSTLQNQVSSGRKSSKQQSHHLPPSHPSYSSQEQQQQQQRQRKQQPSHVVVEGRKVFDVIGFNLQPSLLTREPSQPDPSFSTKEFSQQHINKTITQEKKVKSQNVRSSSAPRQNIKSNLHSRGSVGSLTTAYKSTVKEARSTLQPRHVSPFPRSKSPLAISATIPSTGSRSRSNPPPSMRKDRSSTSTATGHRYSPVKSHKTVESRAQSAHKTSGGGGNKSQKKKTEKHHQQQSQQQPKGGRSRRTTEDVSLSLQSDFHM